MKKIKITTPENIEVEYTLADIGSRAGATIIDMLIQGIFSIIMGIAIFLISQNSPEFWENYYGWIVGISIIVFFLIIYGYYILTEINMNGMTVGKKVFKIRAIRNNGQPITIKHSAIRNIFKVLLDMFGLGVVFIFFTKEHKRIGDLAASTIVVMEKDEIQPITLNSIERFASNKTFEDNQSFGNNESFGYLEDMGNISNTMRAYISQEEYELVSEYLQRKYKLEDNTHIKTELIKYFTRKFEMLDMEDEGEEFVEMLK